MSHTTDGLPAEAEERSRVRRRPFGERRERLLAECREGVQQDDLAYVQQTVERLEVSAQRIGEAIYAAAETGSDSGST